MSLGSILQELKDFETSLLANTMEFLDRTPAHEWYMGGSIQTVTPALGPTVGVAMTCKLDSSTPGQKREFELYWQQVEEMSRQEVPIVWVVQCVGSRPEHECVIGEGMAKALYAAGCVGCVTNGGVRDIRGLMTVGFAAYCRGPVIHHGPLKFTAGGEPVEVGGITVRPGDVIHADSEGVIRIPKGALERLPEAATRMRMAEQDVHRVWRRTDLTVAEKRKWVAEVFAKAGFGHELK